jgi:tetratricopeptide (TPR) repeat protein
MSRILNIYVIQTKDLNNRINNLNLNLNVLKDYAENAKFKVNVNIVNEPENSFIVNNIELYNKRVKYEKEEGIYMDEKFNSIISNLNPYQISNIEKCRAILRLIKNDDELHYIVEDDIFMINNFYDNLKTMFEKLHDKSMIDWDILFTCLVDNIDEPTLNMIDSRSSYKILLSKSSFFINANTANRLYEYLNIFKYNLKIGISKFIWDNKDIRSMILTKHTLFEGSKYGLYPSSVSGGNFLYQNNNYIKLNTISNLDEITDENIESALNIFNNVKSLNSPDILHTMGLIYYKKKDIDNAKKYFYDAYTSLKKNKGYISKSSEILNNNINIYKHVNNTVVDKNINVKPLYSV